MTHQDLIRLLDNVYDELNSIRARDGAPQHIDWVKGVPIQTSSCTEEWWDELTNRVGKMRDTLKQEGVTQCAT